MDPSESDALGRRPLLGVLAAGVVVGAAGCLGEDGNGTDENGAADAEADFPSHPVDEVRDPPEGRRCDGPCGMVTTDWPEWNCQLAHADGQGAFFDTPGCLLTYRHDQTFYGGPEAEIETAWVRDFGTNALIDATEAVYVLDFDTERHEEPMAHNPKPFEDREDAVAYVEQYDDLGEDDIVGIEDFGAEEANAYRDYPLSDDD